MAAKLKLFIAAALCAGFTLGLTAPAWAGLDEGVAAYDRGDYAAALREWRPLAKQGNANTQYNLGIMYNNGRGVPQDFAEAVKWYRKAAEQGMAEAQVNLGVMYMYYNGHGVPQDLAEAVKWNRMAAEQGDAGAQYNLGVMYDNGQGVPQDYAQAHMWFNFAASRFPPGDTRGIAVKSRDNVAMRMTPAQISEAEKLAREWKPKK